MNTQQHSNHAGRRTKAAIAAHPELEEFAQRVKFDPRPSVPFLVPRDHVRPAVVVGDHSGANGANIKVITESDLAKIDKAVQEAQLPIRKVDASRTGTLSEGVAAGPLLLSGTGQIKKLDSLTKDGLRDLNPFLPTDGLRLSALPTSVTYRQRAVLLQVIAAGRITKFYGRAVVFEDSGYDIAIPDSNLRFEVTVANTLEAATRSHEARVDAARHSGLTLVFLPVSNVLGRLLNMHFPALMGHPPTDIPIPVVIKDLLAVPDNIPEVDEGREELLGLIKPMVDTFLENPEANMLNTQLAMRSYIEETMVNAASCPHIRPNPWQMLGIMEDFLVMDSKNSTGGLVMSSPDLVYDLPCHIPLFAGVPKELSWVPSLHSSADIYRMRLVVIAEYVAWINDKRCNYKEAVKEMISADDESGEVGLFDVAESSVSQSKVEADLQLDQANPVLLGYTLNRQTLSTFPDTGAGVTHKAPVKRYGKPMFSLKPGHLEMSEFKVDKVIRLIQENTRTDDVQDEMAAMSHPGMYMQAEDQEAVRAVWAKEMTLHDTALLQCTVNRPAIFCHYMRLSRLSAYLTNSNVNRLLTSVNKKTKTVLNEMIHGVLVSTRKVWSENHADYTASFMLTYPVRTSIVADLKEVYGSRIHVIAASTCGTFSLMQTNWMRVAKATMSSLIYSPYLMVKVEAFNLHFLTGNSKPYRYWQRMCDVMTLYGNKNLSDIGDLGRGLVQARSGDMANGEAINLFARLSSMALQHDYEVAYLFYWVCTASTLVSDTTSVGEMTLGTSLEALVNMFYIYMMAPKDLIKHNPLPGLVKEVSHDYSMWQKNANEDPLLRYRVDRLTYEPGHERKFMFQPNPDGLVNMDVALAMTYRSIKQLDLRRVNSKFEDRITEPIAASVTPSSSALIADIKKFQTLMAEARASHDAGRPDLSLGKLEIMADAMNNVRSTKLYQVAAASLMTPLVTVVAEAISSAMPLTMILRAKEQHLGHRVVVVLGMLYRFLLLCSEMIAKDCDGTNEIMVEQMTGIAKRISTNGYSYGNVARSIGETIPEIMMNIPGNKMYISTDMKKFCNRFPHALLWVRIYMMEKVMAPDSTEGDTRSTVFRTLSHVVSALRKRNMLIEAEILLNLHNLNQTTDARFPEYITAMGGQSGTMQLYNPYQGFPAGLIGNITALVVADLASFVSTSCGPLTGYGSSDQVVIVMVVNGDDEMIVVSMLQGRPDGMAAVRLTVSVNRMIGSEPGVPKTVASSRHMEFMSNWYTEEGRIAEVMKSLMARPDTSDAAGAQYSALERAVDKVATEDVDSRFAQATYSVDLKYLDYVYGWVTSREHLKETLALESNQVPYTAGGLLQLPVIWGSSVARLPDVIDYQHHLSVWTGAEEGLKRYRLQQVIKAPDLVVDPYIGKGLLAKGGVKGKSRTTMSHMSQVLARAVDIRRQSKFTYGRQNKLQYALIAANVFTPGPVYNTNHEVVGKYVSVHPLAANAMLRAVGRMRNLVAFRPNPLAVMACNIRVTDTPVLASKVELKYAPTLDWADEIGKVVHYLLAPLTCTQLDTEFIRDSRLQSHWPQLVGHARQVVRDVMAMYGYNASSLEELNLPPAANKEVLTAALRLAGKYVYSEQRSRTRWLMHVPVGDVPDPLAVLMSGNSKVTRYDVPASIPRVANLYTSILYAYVVTQVNPLSRPALIGVEQPVNPLELMVRHVLTRSTHLAMIEMPIVSNSATSDGWAKPEASYLMYEGGRLSWLRKVPDGWACTGHMRALKLPTHMLPATWVPEETISITMTANELQLRSNISLGRVGRVVNLSSTASAYDLLQSQGYIPGIYTLGEHNQVVTRLGWANRTGKRFTVGKKGLDSYRCSQGLMKHLMLCKYLDMTGAEQKGLCYPNNPDMAMVAGYRSVAIGTQTTVADTSPQLDCQPLAYAYWRWTHLGAIDLPVQYQQELSLLKRCLFHLP